MESVKYNGAVWSKRGVVHRLLYYYRLSSSENVERGLAWYNEAHKFCEDLAIKSGYQTFQIAGVVAALSPMQAWDVNKDLALKFALHNRRNVHTRDQVSKADDCLVADSPEKIFKLLTVNGAKTSHFFWNILYPNTCSGVTIDRHAIGACVYSPSNAKTLADNMGNLTPNQYRFMMDCYVRGAQISNILPHQFQAVIWGVYREQKGLPETYNIQELAPF